MLLKIITAQLFKIHVVLRSSKQNNPQKNIGPTPTSATLQDKTA